MDVLHQILRKNKITAFTEIQEMAIPSISVHKNVLVLSHTGTGKTLVFVLAILENFIRNSDFGSLVIVPTRELCLQVFKVFEMFIELGFSIVHVFGGTDMAEEELLLHRKPNFIVATPGRMAAHLRKGFCISEVNFFVVDEIDKLLEMAFYEDLAYIRSCLVKNQWNILLSATNTDLVKDYISSGNQAFISIKASGKAAIPLKIEHKLLLTPLKAKELHLVYALEHFQHDSVIVFFSSCSKVSAFHRIFKALGTQVSILHGDMKQAERIRSLEEFSKTRKMLATDLVSRGLDLDVTLVINYDLPTGEHVYVHRTGRTGRAGKSGVILNIVTQYDIEKVYCLEKSLDIRLEKIFINRQDVLKLGEALESAKFHSKEVET